MFYTSIDLVWKNVGGHRRYLDRVLGRSTGKIVAMEANGRVYFE